MYCVCASGRWRELEQGHVEIDEPLRGNRQEGRVLQRIPSERETQDTRGRGRCARATDLDEVADRAVVCDLLGELLFVLLQGLASRDHDFF